jgi:hypothetical protein
MHTHDTADIVPFVISPEDVPWDKIPASGITIGNDVKIYRDANADCRIQTQVDKGVIVEQYLWSKALAVDGVLASTLGEIDLAQDIKLYRSTDPYVHLVLQTPVDTGVTVEQNLNVGKSLAVTQNLGVVGYGDLGSLRIGGTEVITSGRTLQNVSLLRSLVSDFWSSPFWSNIPDKPSSFPPSAHASSHEYGGSDLVCNLDYLAIRGTEVIDGNVNIKNVKSIILVDPSGSGNYITMKVMMTPDMTNPSIYNPVLRIDQAIAMLKDSMSAGGFIGTQSRTVMRLQSSGYVQCVESDLGKIVEAYLNGTWTYIGILVYYDNSQRVWWVSECRSFASGTQLRVKNGTGAGYLDTILQNTGGGAFFAGHGFENYTDMPRLVLTDSLLGFDTYEIMGIDKTPAKLRINELKLGVGETHKIYRSSDDAIRVQTPSDKGLIVEQNLWCKALAVDTQIGIGADTNLYRSAADVLKTDDAFEILGPLIAANKLGNTFYDEFDYPDQTGVPRFVIENQAGSITAKIESGEVSLEGAAGKDAGWVYLASQIYSDFELRAKLTPKSTGIQDCNFIFRRTDANNMYIAGFETWEADNTVVIGKRTAGTWIQLASTPFTVTQGQTYNFRIVCVGSRIEVWIDGNLILTATDSDHTKGNVGFEIDAFYSGNYVHAHFDDLRVIPIVNVGAFTDKGLTIGADVNLYRSAADVLKTDDNFVVGNQWLNLDPSSGTPVFNLNVGGVNKGFLAFDGTRICLASASGIPLLLNSGNRVIFLPLNSALVFAGDMSEGQDAGYLEFRDTLRQRVWHYKMTLESGIHKVVDAYYDGSSWSYKRILQPDIEQLWVALKVGDYASISTAGDIEANSVKAKGGTGVPAIKCGDASKSYIDLTFDTVQAYLSAHERHLTLSRDSGKEVTINPLTDSQASESALNIGANTWTDLLTVSRTLAVAKKALIIGHAVLYNGGYNVTQDPYTYAYEIVNPYADWELRILVDGSQPTGAFARTQAIGYFADITVFAIVSLDSGSHTIKLQGYQTLGGTQQVYHRRLDVLYL